MPTTAVIGVQWGDEGKGCIIDTLTESAELVVRYQGGSNAGHTVVVAGEVYKLHLIPSGILHPGVVCLMGDGTAIDPAILCEEIAHLKGRGVDTSGLRISGAAHVVMPYHKALDRAEEDFRGDDRIGTTARGIGPAYADKARRTGIRVYDLVDEARLRRRLRVALPPVNALFEHLYGCPPVAEDDVVAELAPHIPTIRQLTVDGRAIVMDALARDANVLFEGAQATFLDIDYGTYPYLTSSHPVAAGACLGTGMGPLDLDRVYGVAKAYTTRVGAGPFPAEAPEPEAGRLRERGAEYGTTTGRPRRCGWFDAAVVRTSARLNSVSALVLSKLDELDGLDSIKVVTAYKLGAETLEFVPSDTEVYARCEPVFEELPGWAAPIGDARSPDELPAEALEYIAVLSQLVAAPIAGASVGPDREQIVWFDEPEA